MVSDTTSGRSQFSCKHCLAAKATGAANVGPSFFTVPDTNARKFISGGTTLMKATRNNGAGAFSAESPAVTMYQMGVRISQLHDGASSGSFFGVIGS
jgi:hypothetical protein